MEIQTHRHEVEVESSKKEKRKGGTGTGGKPQNTQMIPNDVEVTGPSVARCNEAAAASADDAATAAPPDDGRGGGSSCRMNAKRDGVSMKREKDKR